MWLKAQDHSSEFGIFFSCCFRVLFFFKTQTHSKFTTGCWLYSALYFALGKVRHQAHLNGGCYCVYKEREWGLEGEGWGSDKESSGEAASPERRKKREMRTSHWNLVLFLTIYCAHLYTDTLQTFAWLLHAFEMKDELVDGFKIFQHLRLKVRKPLLNCLKCKYSVLFIILY